MTIRAEVNDRGKRLDSFLSEKMPAFSRSRIQSWIKEGRVLVGGGIQKASFLLRGAEEIAIQPGALPPLKAEAEAIPLTALYEDPAVVAIDKPAGMAVHAGAGIHAGTVVNALLHKFKALSQVGGELRPGIVHRLDRFTSGVLLVAKTDEAHRDLAEQFSSRQVEKIYLTLVEGRMEGKGRITRPITRDPRNRARMTARLETGRAALTSWEVVESFRAYTFLRILLGTGRTHQIRAHMAALGHPVAGDRLYGAAASAWGRYFLHAHRIGFRSPATGERVTVESPLAPELQDWKRTLE